MYEYIVVTGGAGFAGSSRAIHLKGEFPKSTVTAFDNLHRRGPELNVPRSAGPEFDLSTATYAPQRISKSCRSRQSW